MGFVHVKLKNWIEHDFKKPVVVFNYSHKRVELKVTLDDRCYLNVSNGDCFFNSQPYAILPFLRLILFLFEPQNWRTLPAITFPRKMEMSNRIFENFQVVCDMDDSEKPFQFKTVTLLMTSKLRGSLNVTKRN